MGVGEATRDESGVSNRFAAAFGIGRSEERLEGGEP